ncbi:hypothetical protein HDV00_006285 [Rhizophlyctis rosea]|nr:hypothetical protein HDV00_006285 [Rhizophlyctis rosea]
MVEVEGTDAVTSDEPVVLKGRPIPALPVLPLELWTAILALTPSPWNIITANRSFYENIYKNGRNWSLYLRNRFGKALPVFQNCPKLREALTPLVSDSLLTPKPILPRLCVQRVFREASQLHPQAVALILAWGNSLYGTRCQPTDNDVQKFTKSTQQMNMHHNDPLHIRILSVHIDQFKFFLLPNTDLLEAVADVLTKCSRPMIGFLDTIAGNGLKIREVQPYINGYTTIKALNKLRTFYIENHKNVSAVKSYLDWFYYHGFMHIPDFYFQNPIVPLATNHDYFLDDRRLQKTFQGFRSRNDWNSYVTYKALSTVRFFVPIEHQKDLMDWFYTHGFPLTTKAVDLYLDYVIGINNFKDARRYRAIVKDSDFLRAHVPNEVLEELARKTEKP